MQRKFARGLTRQGYLSETNAAPEPGALQILRCRARGLTRQGYLSERNAAPEPGALQLGVFVGVGRLAQPPEISEVSHTRRGRVLIKRREARENLARLCI